MSPTPLGLPVARPPVHGHGNLHAETAFPAAAKEQMRNEQMRANIHHATHTIRAKRANVTAELPDWEALRDAGSAIKQDVGARLPELLEEFEANLTARGAHVHWARDAAEANEIVADLVRATGVDEVIKVKSMATQEIGLDEYLAGEGIAAIETDLAELIVQLGHDKPSHILVPAIHRNRDEIREIFLNEMPGVDASLSTEPAELADAARTHLREKFLSTSVAISGANFGVADTGTLAVVESEGNGRMCLTLPDTLITVMGIEKLVPTFDDLEVFLQLLPRSSTGERMNPYTSMWTGVTPDDGPQDVHVILLDNGRTAVLDDPAGRSAGNPSAPLSGQARPLRPALHPLLRLPQRLPRLRACGRPRLRLDLSRSHRGDPLAAAHGHHLRGERLPAVRFLPVRRVLRRLPRQDQHPRHPRPPPRPRRRGGESHDPQPDGPAHEGRVRPHVPRPVHVGGRTLAPDRPPRRPPRHRLAARHRRRLDPGAGHPHPTGAVLPSLVGHPGGRQ